VHGLIKRSRRGVNPHLAAQRQPLGHAESVLLVDDGQRQVPELHLLLDHRVRAHHQRGRTGLDPLQHLTALFLLLAAAEARDLNAQRLQPANQLVEVLLGQDLGGRHQRALPAGVDGDGSGQRRHHGLAGAHIALQKAVHRHGPGQVARDFLADASLGTGQSKRQGGQQAFVQAARMGAQRRGPQAVAFTLGLQLGELLGQQLLGFQALPGRVAACFELGDRHLRRRAVQKGERTPQVPRRDAGISV
jgi:hypothetical protein